jgi:hypothetical protein
MITGFINMPQICDMGQTALLPFQTKACCGFFRPKNLTASARFEPAILSTIGQHAISSGGAALAVGYIIVIDDDTRSTKCQRVNVFDNWVLRQIFGHEREEVTGDGRKLHVEELHDLCSPNIFWFYQIKKNEVGKACVTCGVEEKCINILVRKHRGKRLLGRSMYRWNYIKMDL